MSESDANTDRKLVDSARSARTIAFFAMKDAIRHALKTTTQCK